MKHLSSKILLVVTTGLIAASANAAIDTTFVSAMQTDIVGVVTAIGGALLIAGGTAVAFKWGKGALFG